MVKIAMGYHFDYTEKFNDKTLVHLEWDRTNDSDFENMKFYFIKIADRLRLEGIAVNTFGDEEHPFVCGYIANCGPSEGDTLTKVLKVEYKEIGREEIKNI